MWLTIGLGAFALLPGAGLATPLPTVFTYDGHEQTYRVPANVKLVGLQVVGAEGGSHGGGYGDNWGMILDGYLAVQSGETLYAEVGQDGTQAGGPTFGGGGAAGRYPGQCSTSSTAPCAQVLASSGGGASDVRTCSMTVVACAGGGGSPASRLLVAGGSAGEGGTGSSPGFLCTQIPNGGTALNPQPLPGSNPAAGPVPIATATGTIIPGQSADAGYGGAIAHVSPAQGGASSPGAGGSLSPCTSTVSFAPTVPGTSATKSAGGAGGSITGTQYAAPEGPSGYLPGAGGGGGGGYTPGGGGAAGYVCTGDTSGSPCDNPSPGMGGGGGSSFISNKIISPRYPGDPSPTPEVTIAPLVVIDSPQQGAVYHPGQAVTAKWSCAFGGTPFQGGACGPATDASGSPINTSPGPHTFVLTVGFVGTQKTYDIKVTYTIKAGGASRPK